METVVTINRMEGEMENLRREISERQERGEALGSRVRMVGGW